MIVNKDELFTIEHINVNGINIQYDLVELEHVLRTMINMEASIFSVNEHTINCNNKSVRKKIDDLYATLDSHGKLSLSSNTHTSIQKTWQPGGALLGVNAKWRSRMISTGADSMGRWAWADFRGKEKTTIN